MVQAAQDIDIVKITGLLDRVEECEQHGLTLEKADLQLVAKLVKTLTYLTKQIEGANLTMRKLRKLLGMEQKSEKTSKPRNGDKKPDQDKQPPDSESAEPAESTPESALDHNAQDSGDVSDTPSTSNPDEGKAKPGHGKRGHTDFEQAKTLHHALCGLSKGDRCPECGAGTLYKYEPSVLLRIVGNPPLQAEKHISERLRCNACNVYFTAQLPEEVIRDGGKDSRFSYSAIVMLAMLKYLVSNPFYRIGSLQKMTGLDLSASTIYDQVAKFAKTGAAVHQHLAVVAANSTLAYIDDTTNRILKSEQVESKKTKRLKSQVYTSVFRAEAEQGTSVVLYKTSVGNAGDFADEILSLREQNAGAIILMSDALSHNGTTKGQVSKALCNVHARRNFYDLKVDEPDAVEPILDLYSQIYALEKETRDLSSIERLEQRRIRSLPLMNEIKTLTTRLVDSGEFEPNSNMGKAVAYLQKHWSSLIKFCEEEHAPIDNNPAENALRLIVLARKNQFFYKTQAGADTSDICTSILATCKLNDVNPHAYGMAIMQNEEAVSENPSRWMPWNYTENFS